MALRYYANAPATALTNSCSALATSITVDSVTGLPISYPYTLIIDRGLATEEVVEVTAAAGTTLTVTRGADSTTAFAHAASASVVHGITARDVREPNAHVNANSGVHGVTGDVVGTTDTQTLTNKTLTSPVLTGNPTGPTPATSDSDTSLATTAFVKAVLLAAHPVGCIEMNVTGANPSTYIGGTWVAWGAGRVPVGLDAGQAEFDSVEETGGAKTHTLSAAEMPVHSHGVNDPGHQHQYSAAVSSAFVSQSGATYGVTVPNNQFTDSNTTGITIQDAGSGAAHNNLQPYIVCYMWKRTA